ncbi:MAG: ABC transporter substrate-binding protein [Bacteroidota bacterium]
MKRLSLLGILGILLSGCTGNSSDESFSYDGGEESFTTYATGFEVSDFGDFKLVGVHDPWQNSRNVTFSYVLAGNSSLVPDSLSDLPFIKTPVQRVITLSTTHVAMINELGKAKTIKGASGSGFIYDPAIRQRIEAGEILEVGYDQGLNFETIVNLDPDVLFMYGVEGSVRAMKDKLTELGVPVVFCGDYLEPHPLGKAEWIRFFSLFYGVEEESSQMFDQVDSTYQALAALTARLDHKPVVLTGLPWKSTWYMAGGKSFAARLIEDAGGDYLWSDNQSTEAIPLDLESVYGRAVRADIWINPGAAGLLEELNRFDERFKELPVLQQGRVFNNNQRLTDAGGNDYWESGSVRPHLVLADLIKVFHPDLMTDHQFIYYRKLK